MNQDRDYIAGEKVSLGVRTNAELIAAAHRTAERLGLSTSKWIQSVITPLIVAELRIDPRVLEPGGGFDCRMPRGLPAPAALTQDQHRKAAAAARVQAIALDYEKSSRELQLALAEARRLGVAVDAAEPPTPKRKRR